MGYRPANVSNNNKPTFSYSLKNELVGKNEADIIWMTPKILRMLASRRIDIENEGYLLLDKKVLNTLITTSYEKCIQAMWDRNAYDALLQNIQYGVYIISSEQEWSLVNSYRNKASARYTGYLNAYNGLTELAKTKNLFVLDGLIQNIKPYIKFF